MRDDPIPSSRLLRRTQNHLYLRPHPALRGCVAHYTLTFPAVCPRATVGFSASQTLTILPDISGCWVFSLEPGLPNRFWGASTTAVQLNRDFEQAPERFFVEFLPGGAHRLTGLSMHELTNRVFSVQETLPSIFHAVKHILEQHLPLAHTLHSIDALLLSLLAQQEKTVTAALPLPQLYGVSGVHALALATGYSERHLNRLFRTTLGVSVKRCAQVLRINRVLSLLHPGTPLAALAQEAGYCDQSHLNHDFKAVCGVSPTAYLHSMSEFYKEDYKF